MTNYSLNRTYSELIRQLETTDKVHADTFNPIFNQIINNAAAHKDRLDGHDAQLADIACNVKSYGAKGDGTTDDTVSIQNAINAVLTTSGGRLFFPNGTYKITSVLTVPFATGFIIEGASRGGTTIKQFTDNTPIFKFTSELIHSWAVREITFDYANHQPNTNTLAIPVYFELPSGTSVGSGMFNFLIDRCTFSGGYYGIMQTASSQQLPLWGVHIKDCTFGGYLSGGAVNINPIPAIGQPILKLEDVYIDATNMTKNVVAIYASDTVLLDSVEVNNGSASSGVPQFEIQSCQNVTLLNTRCESLTVNGTATVWDFANSYVTVLGCSQTLKPSASAAVTGITANNSGRLAIHGFEFTYSTLGTSAVGYAVDSDDLIIVENLNIPSSSQTAFSRYKSWRPQPRIDMLYVQPNKTKFQGDADVTLTMSDLPVQYFNTTFTANHQVTLPNTGVYDGAEFTITKWTTDAFTLKVYCPLSGKSVTIPASNKGATKWRCTGNQWVPLSQSTFS